MKTANNQATTPKALEKDLITAASEINNGKLPDLKRTSTLLNSAARAIAKLAQDADAFGSTYGDNWYDGFNAAKKLQEDKHSCISSLTEDEILAMSEHAETDKLNANRKKEELAQHLFAELYQVLGCHEANTLALDITRDAANGIYRTNELLPYVAHECPAELRTHREQAISIATRLIDNPSDLTSHTKLDGLIESLFERHSHKQFTDISSPAQLEAYWQQALQYRMECHQEVQRLESCGYGFYHRHLHHEIETNNEHKHESFYEFLTDAKRPLGNKCIASSVIFTLGWDHKRTMTKVEAPKWVQDKAIKIFNLLVDKVRIDQQINNKERI